MTEKQSASRAHGKDGWQFWIDRGGTFTDILAVSPEHRIRSLKLLSENPEQYQDAALAGIRQMLDLGPQESIPDSLVRSVKMGTTVATNALLERKGEPTLLVITKGFADALRIGYQNRPDIFAREIRLPDQLYRAVVEADERIDAAGNIIQPLDEAALRRQFAEARAQGVDAVAIAFLHAWSAPAHEQIAGRLAREAGFRQVSLSHEIAPLIKLISRADTTVADAYLSPVLRRYVEQVAAGLNPDKLFFMQSSGGLTRAQQLQGRNSILSGPAGGVVGMVETARQAGFDKLLGFDMGGTSTDVSLYQGDYQRRLDHVIDGVRLRAPMLAIDTVAAGGGSLLRFADGRLQVGPESAGARPGPVAYGRDGPLAVTDIQVLLGRIRPEYFPRVFGDDARQPLQANTVRKAFEHLNKQVITHSGTGESEAALAASYLEIAVNLMANAVRKIAAANGVDLTRFTLCSFGGAGGQHACAVARACGIRGIFIHNYSSLLSAYGMGLAPRSTLREASVELPLADHFDAALERTDALVRDARDNLLDQGLDKAQIRITRHLELRYQGSDSALSLNFDELPALREDFARQHQTRFGFVQDETPLIIDKIKVEARVDAAPPHTATGVPRTPASPVACHPVYFDDGWQDTPFYSLEEVAAGQTLSGPAILYDKDTTLVVEPDWQVTRTGEGHWHLQDQGRAARQDDSGASVDPARLEIFNHLFIYVAEQMGLVLQNTAHSVNIKERLDFSCALFDASGNLLANAPHMPVHLGSMGESVQSILRQNRDSLAPGDTWLINAPYQGGTHLPDLTVVTPVFDEAGKQLLYILANRGHHADIGGITPGSMPADSCHIGEEGIVFENFLLVRSGRLQEAALREALGSGDWPSRNPDQNVADLKAQIAANQSGIREMDRAFDQYGKDQLLAYMQHVQDNAELAIRRIIPDLQAGSFSYPMDCGATICVSVQPDPDTATIGFDFTGTSAQQAHNFNAPYAVTHAAILYVLRSLLSESIPLNAGCLRPVSVTVPKGSLLHPEYPAAVVAGNVETSQCITDAIYGALGLQAGAQGTMNNVTFGNARHQYYETLAGGSGAGPDYHGTDAVHTHMTNSRLTDPEVLEARFPVRLRAFAIRNNSGGDGQYRGGNGLVRELEFLEPMSVSLLTNNRQHRPFGLAGGEAGKAGRNSVIKCNGDCQLLPASVTLDLDIGERLRIETPGGGGYGSKAGAGTGDNKN